jgi:hypothetical protein
MNTDTKKLAREAFAARMGQEKTKNSASKLDRFSLFSAYPSLLGSSGAPANPRNPWLVFSNRDRELLTMKLQYVACI